MGAVRRHAIWLWLLFPAAVNADDQQFITVSGLGTVLVWPDVVELEGTVQGKGALAGDAATTFDDVKQVATAAIEDLALEGVEVVSEKLSIGDAADSNPSRMILRASRGEEPPEQEVAVRETLKVRLPGVDKLEKGTLLSQIVKIVDAGKESGLTFVKPASLFERSLNRGEPVSFLSFRRSDLPAVEQEAEGLALADARARAERLAKLAGLKVGAIVSIEDTRIPTVVPRTGDPGTRKQLEQIKVEKQLRVKFELTES